MWQRLRLGTMKPCRLSAGAALVLAAAGISDLPAWAQTFQELHAFGTVAYDGSDPEGALIQGTDGNFYGSTTAGGASGDGTVFKMTPGGALTTLFSFSGGNGSFPYGALMQANDGNLYGATMYGGAGDGTIYRITTNGDFTLLGFWGPNGVSTWDFGAYPVGDLAQGADGFLYGVTQQSNGTVFKVSTNGTGYQTLFAFGYPDPRGCDPSGGLLLATDGNSTGNGSHGNGNVFRIIMPGSLLSYTQKSDLR